MTSAELRRRFLAYFEKRGHTVLPSASLVPENDPTVLFTTAGMHPLVPYILGLPHPGGKRLTSAQKCVRTGDIDEVGDNRHLTFFEMLGNWSLGDYFKKDSLNWSFDFLTNTEVGLGLDPHRLYVTVFAGDENSPRDEEAIEIWKEIFAGADIAAMVDVPVAEGGRIFTKGADNWWGPAGSTGPCGPDSEMHYDTGTGVLTDAQGFPDFDSGRIVEVWNNVFMQYEKTSEGSFEPLKQKVVDTGAGFERLCMILQKGETVFDTDLFTPLIDTLRLHNQALSQAALRICADHFRASIMLIADGVTPSNKDRGYVLRRLIRRACLHLGLRAEAMTSALEAMVSVSTHQYSDAYPELLKQKESILETLKTEMQKFTQSIEKGKKRIESLSSITGADAFDLYQSFGFPLELTMEYATTRGLRVDKEQFTRAFEKHQMKSRAAAGSFASGLADHSEATTKLHTATHLLHQALRRNLGNMVAQKGSNITPERLRFDFSYPQKLEDAVLRAIEAEVNEIIARDLKISCETMSPQKALSEGVIGLFGDKYGEVVTVYSIGDYSREICTGPHASRTGELGRFRILKEEAVSAGVRRIKAVLE